MDRRLTAGDGESPEALLDPAGLRDYITEVIRMLPAGRLRTAVARSTKRNADLVLVSPNHLTSPARASGIKRERKRIRNTDRRRQAHARTEVRQIEDSAVEKRRVTIQNDFGILQHARALNLSLLHGRFPNLWMQDTASDTTSPLCFSQNEMKFCGAS
jgi:hypothetical protein